MLDQCSWIANIILHINSRPECLVHWKKRILLYDVMITIPVHLYVILELRIVKCSRTVAAIMEINLHVLEIDLMFFEWYLLCYRTSNVDLVSVVQAIHFIFLFY